MERVSPTECTGYRDLRIDRRGVSLVESMIVIGIMAMLMVILVQIFALNYEIYLKQSARIDTEIGAIFAARQISDLTRGASGVIGTLTINGTAYTSSAHELVLKIPAITTDGDIIGGSYDHVAISRDPLETTQVFADTEAATGSRRFTGKKLITAYNNTIQFRYNAPEPNDADRVSVYILNQAPVRASVLRTEAWTSLFLRNK